MPTFDENGNEILRFTPIYGATYVFVKSSAATTWTITHNIGKYPTVVCLDGSSNVMVPDIAYNSASQVTLTFSASVSGTAYLN